MKLIRFGPVGHEKPGVLLPDGTRRDVSALIADYDHAFFQSGGLNKLREVVTRKTAKLPTVSADARWGAPIARPLKLLAIGLNYRDHAAESGLKIPEEPILFHKGTNTVVGPYDNIQIPRKSKETDWEIELGIVIAADSRYLADEAAAHKVIAGWTICHDVSEREFQIKRSGQWTKGKSCDTFCPAGPFLATPDEIPVVNNLSMTLTVNGERKQTGSTNTMIFNPYFIVYYLSQFMTLEAGDLITTGTPPGVGLARKPPEFLKAGDVVVLEIEGLGSQKSLCVNA